jgi:hypothetical protein
MSNRTEQRKHRRFTAAAGSTAVLKDNHNNAKPGRILNISKGGLAIACIHFEEENTHIAVSKVNIFREKDDFHLTDLPCKIVSNQKTAKDFPFNPLILNKYSVQFVDLTPPQISHLNYLIESSAKNAELIAAL